MAAEIQKSQPDGVGSGSAWKRSLPRAYSITLPKPPARSEANQRIATRPSTMMIICTKSVIATDHMPPTIV